MNLGSEANGSGPIKVAYLIHSMRTGGAERSIARLINALDPAEFSSMVICMTHTGPAAQWIHSRTVPVIELNRSGSFDFRAASRLAGILRESRIDIVHSHNWGTLLESVLACRMARVPAHVHAERGTVLGQVEMRGLRMRIRGWVAGWALRHCDAVVTNAKTVAQRIADRCGYPADKVLVIANGVEDGDSNSNQPEVKVIRSSLNIPEHSLVLGSVGRLARVKGLDIAIQSLQELREARNIHLLLVGDGPERGPLEALARQLNIAHLVHFAGHQSNSSPWMRAIDIFLNCSHSEGMSQSLLEAMAAGKPMIATDVGDSAELLGRDDSCGVLIPPNNSEQLTAAIQAILPASIRNSLGSNARKRFEEQFSLSKMAHRYESLYREILSGNANRTTLRPNTAIGGGKR